MAIPRELETRVMLEAVEIMENRPSGRLRRYYPRVRNDGAGDKVFYDILTFANRILRPTARGGPAGTNSGPSRGQVALRGVTIKERLPLTMEELKDMRDVGSMTEANRQAAVGRALRQILLDFERTWDFWFAQWLTAGALTTSANACPGVPTGTVYVNYDGMDLDSAIGVDLGMSSDNIVATVAASWADPTTDIFADLRAQQQVIAAKTGVRASTVLCNQETYNYVLANNKVLGSEVAKAELLRTGTIGTPYGFTFDVIDDVVVDAADLFSGGAGAAQPMWPDNVVSLVSSDNLASGRGLIECEPDDGRATAQERGFYPFTDEQQEHPRNISPGATETAIPMLKVPNSQVVFVDVTDTTP